MEIVIILLISLLIQIIITVSTSEKGRSKGSYNDYSEDIYAINKRLDLLDKKISKHNDFISNMKEGIMNGIKEKIESGEFNIKN